MDLKTYAYNRPLLCPFIFYLYVTSGDANYPASRHGDDFSGPSRYSNGELGD